LISWHKEKLLPSNWITIGAQPTYNPLSRTLTFLLANDIMEAIDQVMKN